MAHDKIITQEGFDLETLSMMIGVGKKAIAVRYKKLLKGEIDCDLFFRPRITARPKPLKKYTNGNGEVYTWKDVVEKTGLSKDGAIKRLQLWENNEISTERLMKPKMTTERVFKRGKKSYTIDDVIKKVRDLHRLGARTRLCLWEQGKISEKQLFAPKRTHFKPIDADFKESDGFGGLTKEERDLLNNIPGPTLFEQQHPELFEPVKDRY